MDELHAAIADYLRAQRRVLTLDEAKILNIWRERGEVPRCKVCGALIDDDDNGLFNLDDMMIVRQCNLHYTPF